MVGSWELRIDKCLNKIMVKIKEILILYYI